MLARFLHSLRCAATAAFVAAAAGAVTPVAAQTAPPPAGPASSANRNVYEGGAHVRPRAPVAGDYAAAGGRVVVDRAVQGDATLGGGSVEVRAPVGDDLRAVAGEVYIDSAVGGELFASGGSLVLSPAGSVARGASLYGSTVRIEGRVEGTLDVTAQKIRIDGEVGGDARLVAPQIELGPRARIAGALHYVSGSELQRAPGATIVGPVTREAPARGADPQPQARRWQWQHAMHAPAWAPGLLAILGLLACAAVFLLLLPGFGRQAAQRLLRTPWLALAVGFGSAAALPVLAVLLFVTLLGIPLGIAVLALYPVLLLVGFLVGVLSVADLVPARLGRPLAQAGLARIGWFAAALLLVLAIGWLPFVGGLLVAALALAGVGSVVLELHQRLRGRTPPGSGTALPQSVAARPS